MARHPEHFCQNSRALIFLECTTPACPFPRPNRTPSHLSSLPPSPLFPQWDPGVKPLIRGLVGGRSPLEADHADDILQLPQRVLAEPGHQTLTVAYEAEKYHAIGDKNQQTTVFYALPVWKGQIELFLSVRSSVRLSVGRSVRICSFVAYIANNSRSQRLSVPKFKRKVPHLRCDSHTSFNVKRSIVRVTRGDPLMLTHIVRIYLQNGKAYELQTWYTKGGRRPASATGTMTSKVKDKGRKVT